MRKLFMLAGVLVAAAAGVIFYRRSRRPLAAASPDAVPVLDPSLVITDADLVEPEPITQVVGDGIDVEMPRR